MAGSPEYAPLPPLPLDDPIEALGMLRGAVCDQRIYVKHHGLKGQYSPLQSRLTCDLQDKYKYPNTVDLRTVGKKACAAIVRYTLSANASPQELPRDFIYSLGALITTDANGLKEHKILKPEQVALYQSQDIVPYLYETYADEPELSQEATRKFISSYPSNPQMAIERYLSRLRYCREDLVPNLCAKYDLPPINPGMLRSMCKTGTRYKDIEETYKQSQNIAKTLSVEPEDVFRVLSTTPGYYSLVNESIKAIHNFAHDDPIKIDKQSLELLTALREWRRSQKTYMRFKYNYRLRTPILAYAIRTAIKVSPTYQQYKGMDIPIAASFVETGFPHTQISLASDLRTKTRIALAYLQDVRCLQAQELPRAYAIARHHSPDIVTKLRKRYPGVASWIIRENAHLIDPGSKLTRICNVRDAIMLYAQSKGDIELPPNAAERLAARSRLSDSAAEIVERYIDTCRDLSTAWADEDWLEPWMIPLAAATGNPNSAIKHFLSLARIGYRQARASLDDESSFGTSYKGIASNDADPVHLLAAGELSAVTTTMLGQLSVEERAAVTLVFDTKLQTCDGFDEPTLERFFNTNNIETYVLKQILPKLRANIDL